MYAEGTMLYPRGQTRIWERTLLIATAVGIVLMGVIIARNVGSNDSLSVTFIQEEANRQAFTLYIDEVWNNGNVDVLETIVNSDVIYHDSMLAEDVVGVDGVSELITSYRAAMLDFTYTVDAVSTDGDRVWAQITASGTHTNTLELAEDLSIPATMNTATWSVTVISRFDDGKIIETWVQTDTQNLMEQLGISSSLQQQVTEEENAEIARQFVELWNNPETTEEEVRSFYTAATIPSHGVYTDGSVLNAGAGGVARNIQGSYFIWPDFEVGIQNVAATDDVVVVHSTVSGTFSETLDPNNVITPGSSLEPDNELHQWEWVFVLRFEDSKIAEIWQFWNSEFIAAHTR